MSLIGQLMKTEEYRGQYLGVVDVKCLTDREDLTARKFNLYFSPSTIIGLAKQDGKNG